ncbi:DUF6049 family protein [Actinocorallia populi]|uniref:DUF6049 family protein n=1 Tax=Actinocorallia populi TaxID=2079200 RepID=UPI000D094191|nr:DUF6049 family protein [Actinocorallia populi]
MKARFTAALGALVLLFAAAPFLPGAAPAAFAGSQRQDTLTVVLEGVKPSILVAKTKKLTVQAKITNRGARPLTGLGAQLQYGDAFTTRGQLDQFSRSQTEESVPHVLDPSDPFDLAPGASKTVKLSGDAANVFARRSGSLSVYPLAVTVSSAATGRLGGVHTYVNYVPKDVRKTGVQPTRVSFVWPLIDAPHRTTENRFYDDELAASLAPGGEKSRLNDLLSALGSADKSVTLAIDPGLLGDVEAMQKAYRVRGQEEEKPGSKDASAWLQKLKAYVKSPKSAFFLTPYGDVDTVALVNKRLANGQSSLLKAAYADKKVGLDLLEKSETYPPLAWTNGGTINQKTIDRLSAGGKLGSSYFLLSSSQLMAANGITYTPSAAATVETSKGRQKTAIAFDDTIQQIISADTRSPGAALGARQRYLAETAMITAEAPSESRTLVVSPDRRWNPDPEFARSLLAEDARSGWLKPVPLGEVAAAKNRTADRTFVTYPDEDRELTAHYLEGVKSMNKTAYAFSKIFPEPDTSLQRTAMRTASNYWRGNSRRQNAAYAFQGEAEKDHQAAVNRVSLVEGTEKQLAGSSGVLRFTIANEFPEGSGPVDVVIEISTYPAGRLVFPDENEEDLESYVLERRIEGNQKDTLLVPVKLPTGSSFTNEIEVVVKISNRERGEINSQSVFVKTTGISSIGVFITVGALGVLVVGVGFRGMRARRRRKEEEAQHDGAAV